MSKNLRIPGVGHLCLTDTRLWPSLRLRAKAQAKAAKTWQHVDILIAPEFDAFAVFIKHFDKEHMYYNGIYYCHQSPYKDTGLTKAEIKREFEKVVERHKKEISQWAGGEQRKERYALYLRLKEEFEGGESHEHRI